MSPPSRVSGAPATTLAQARHQAAALHRAGRLDEALRWYDAILQVTPDDFTGLHMSGIVAAQLGNNDEACRRLQRAVEVDPRSAPVRSDLGNVQKLLGRCEEALASWERALALKPDFAEAESNRSVALNELGRYDEALASCERALALNPEFADAWNNKASILLEVARFKDALASSEQALALVPDFPEALLNRGAALCAMSRLDAALASCDRALALVPRSAEALNLRGVVLHALDRREEALASFDEALALKPRLAIALQNRGASLAFLRRHEDAARDFEAALVLAPALAFARGQLLHSRMQCCDWRDFDSITGQVLAGVRAGERAADPFVLLGVTDSAPDQMQAARTWVAARCPPSPTPLWRGERYGHDRIRVAYLSADFHEHATAYLMAELFEQHDRGRFAVYAIASGPDDGSAMRSRLQRAFEHFIDVRHMGDEQVAQRLRDLEIDIAVDLKGFTHEGHPEVFAYRPAPVQVNYLGYPGTLGSPYHDYIVADEVVIPEAARRYFTEEVVYVPDSYQVNDRRRTIAERTPARGELGLPAEGFVFCSFNNNYKITPALFDVWMRLLRAVDGSVLWLLAGNTTAPGNLRREAAARGVAPERLVFASRMDLPAHLARQRLADLFLDTLPCNAHTTASDALWAGLPVLTCAGTTFAGRVAASLLRAVGLPELITQSLAEYEALALRLAQDPDALAALRTKLAHNRDTCPLFDSDRARRHLEDAYTTMWQRFERGEVPAGFAVAPIAH